MSWGLIYKACLRTKRGLKVVYATYQAKVVIYKNKLGGRMCAPVSKLWVMRAHILETLGSGDADGEVEKWSQIFIDVSHKFNVTLYPP